MIGLSVVLHTLLGFANSLCPNGWTRFSGSCYLFGHEQLDFDGAEVKIENS